MKAEFIDGLGKARSGVVTGRRKKRRPNNGFKDVRQTRFNSSNESKLPPFIRVRLGNGTEVEVHSSRVATSSNGKPPRYRRRGVKKLLRTT